MRTYVTLGAILLLAIWDVTRNQGLLVRAVGGLFVRLLRAIGWL